VRPAAGSPWAVIWPIDTAVCACTHATATAARGIGGNGAFRRGRVRPRCSLPSTVPASTATSSMAPCQLHDGDVKQHLRTPYVKRGACVRAFDNTCFLEQFCCGFFLHVMYRSWIRDRFPWLCCSMLWASPSVIKVRLSLVPLLGPRASVART
jgi:hypothetical protein